jgi:ribosomal protein S18 acetylase RimI-like enzyme
VLPQFVRPRLAANVESCRNVFRRRLSIRPLDPFDSTSGFKAGDPAAQPLKSFFQKQAQEFHQHSIAKTYVAEGATGDAAEKLLGFITLIASEIDIRGGYVVDDPAHANRYASLPAVKLARLAVDSRFRGCRIGEALVDFSLAVVVGNVTPHIGCRFLVTDAKQPAVAFYEKMGFTLLDTDDNRERENPVMFIDLLKC